VNAIAATQQINKINSSHIITAAITSEALTV